MLYIIIVTMIIIIIIIIMTILIIMIIVRIIIIIIIIIILIIHYSFHILRSPYIPLLHVRDLPNWHRESFPLFRRSKIDSGIDLWSSVATVLFPSFTKDSAWQVDCSVVFF